MFRFLYHTKEHLSYFPMSLRRSSYVALTPPRGLKNANRLFLLWNRTSLEESLLQIFFLWKLSAAKLWGIHWLNYPCKNYWWVTFPSTWNFGSNWQRWSEIANFRYIFARSASAVTSSEKSSIITNRKSTTLSPMSPRWTSYVVPKPPKGGSKMQSVQILNNKLRYLWNGTR